MASAWRNFKNKTRAQTSRPVCQSKWFINVHPKLFGERKNAPTFRKSFWAGPHNAETIRSNCFL